VSKNIKRIRKSIQERKRARHANRLNRGEHFPYEMISDEERHGVYDQLAHHDTKGKNKSEERLLRSPFFYQLSGAVMLFFVSLFIIKTDVHPFTKSEKMLRNALQDNFPFATVHGWYVDYLGVPLSLVPRAETTTSVSDNLYQTPLMGEVVESFSVNGTGIQIMPESESYVRSVDKGIVVYAGKRNDTNQTVVIQHADRSETTYGKLSSIDVHLYQLVEVNDVIGSINPAETEETLFFSIQQQSGYVDPIQVINVNGSP